VGWFVGDCVFFGRGAGVGVGVGQDDGCLCMRYAFIIAGWIVRGVIVQYYSIIRYPVHKINSVLHMLSKSRKGDGEQERTLNRSGLQPISYSLKNRSKETSLINLNNQYQSLANAYQPEM
jgi:hypothetical protein